MGCLDWKVQGIMEKGGEKKEEKRDREETGKITGWVETEGVTLLRQPHEWCKDGGADLWEKRL